MRVLGTTTAAGKRRFCDARCHNSTKRNCGCICGGLLHGKGEHYAKLNAGKASFYVGRIPDNRFSVWLNPELIPIF